MGKHYPRCTCSTRCMRARIKGFFAIGAGPGVQLSKYKQSQEGLEKLDWLVGENIFDNETYSFWKGPGVDPKKIKTEVFLLPAAASMEKEAARAKRPHGAVEVQGRGSAGRRHPVERSLSRSWRRSKPSTQQKAVQCGRHPEPQVGLHGQERKYDA